MTAFLMVRRWLVAWRRWLWGAPRRPAAGPVDQACVDQACVAEAMAKLAAGPPTVEQWERTVRAARDAAAATLPPGTPLVVVALAPELACGHGGLCTAGTLPSAGSQVLLVAAVGMLQGSAPPPVFPAAMFHVAPEPESRSERAQRQMECWN